MMFSALTAILLIHYFNLMSSCISNNDFMNLLKLLCGGGEPWCNLKVAVLLLGGMGSSHENHLSHMTELPLIKVILYPEVIQLCENAFWK